ESPRSTEHIKRMATNLVNKWGQPILGISVNYKDRQLQRVEYDPEQIRAPIHHTIDASEERQSLQSTFDYDVLPQARIQIARSKKTDDPYRHLKQTMARM
ncbi:25341_t:CDS:2, partial [Racocetra persica]